MTPNPGPRMADGFRKRGGEITRIEAFVDAAFAFAVTLLVISVDAIPESRAELVAALKGIPAFAVSFVMIAWFWYGHASHTRRYGLDDRTSILLSLLLVFLVLVFVYPLKVMYASFMQWISSGFLVARFKLESTADLRLIIVVFGLALGSMGAVMALLTEHAWRRRDALGLDRDERIATRLHALSWWFVPVVALVSMLVALFVPALDGHAWTHGLGGMVYALLGLQGPVIAWRHRRLLEMP
ncbi:TMEM175 family protein [Dokdonella sp.]|uniref:TMEM175 family protein n=1 Tax=Dokdonella sp. TaxID=2291710 RepID=UPI0025BCCA36|nr:TMEM175 family protein [Dokdonella sp.]MBX3690970.1 DUF1211 domain-containing protein [Dokdonella sp.]